MTDNKINCLICGVNLKYRQEERTEECTVCQSQFSSAVSCEYGHYVCDGCHSLQGNDWIEQMSNASIELNPMNLAIKLMEHPSVKMHGPEHHFLVPAVLLSIYFNIKNETSRKAKAISQARKRAEKVPGGFCGFCGNCGAAVGTGIFVSVLLEASPLTTESWSLSNRMTAQSLSRVADYGGPRCCKRDTFLALQSAVEFSKTHLDVYIGEYSQPLCTFSDLNKECLKNNCPFYNPL